MRRSEVQERLATAAGIGKNTKGAASYLQSNFGETHQPTWLCDEFSVSNCLGALNSNPLPFFCDRCYDRDEICERTVCARSSR
jgi:hypothetical protein